jgi:sugar lactone lactonase YvrE
MALSEPFDVVEEARGSYLVADRTANVVYRLRSGKLRAVATMPLPRDLELVRGGRLLVASERNVLSLDPATGHIQRVAAAKAVVLGVALLRDGAIAVSEDGNRIVRLDRGRRTVLATGLDGVHGLLSTDRGLVACESSTGRVLRLAKRVEVIAEGLELPSFAVPASGGALYVAEFGAGRISHVAASGKKRTVAAVPSPAGISLTSRGDILVASLDGRVARIDPLRGRVVWLV